MKRIKKIIVYLSALAFLSFSLIFILAMLNLGFISYICLMILKML